MQTFPSLSTHILLWHTSPMSALPAIRKEGISLMREYVWCGTNPLRRIFHARKFTGDYILSSIALPRRSPRAFLWEKTRDDPDGDPHERTFDHGGGGNDEVKVWTAIPREHIHELFTDEEVERRLQACRKSDDAPHHTGWLPSPEAFAEECRSLLLDPGTNPEIRTHAGHYLQIMGLLIHDPDLRHPLLEIVATCSDLVDDALAVCCGLISTFDQPWFEDALTLVDSADVPEAHLARMTALACARHDEEQMRAALSKHSLEGTAQLLARALPHLIASHGQDAEAAALLTAAGAPATRPLVAFLLGTRQSNPTASSIIQTLGAMPSPIAAQPLVDLLRRRRDVSSKARRTITLVLQKHLDCARHGLEQLAQKGHHHARIYARQLLIGKG